MKNLEESPEENASTFCLFKDYCSQTMEESKFSCFVGDLGVGGEKMSLNVGCVHLQMTEYTGFCQEHYIHFYKRRHRTFPLAKANSIC